MTNDKVEDDLIELEHCNLVCLVSDLAGDEKESWPQPECQLVGSWTLFIAISDEEDHLYREGLKKWKTFNTFYIRRHPL